MKELVLLTLGSEGERDAEPHFHPLASLAFDPELSSDDPGQWLALWVYGPSPAGWGAHLSAVLPLPFGAPKASTSTLERLERRLEAIQEGSTSAPLPAPEPVVHLGNLEEFPRSPRVWNTLRRGLSWANVLNPAQLLFRTYMVRRKDSSERRFQRSYLALQWLQDVGFSGSEEARWVEVLTDLRFHLLRNRSLYGGWLDHADGPELVHNYESDTRRKLGKSSSWLQSAANEHDLRYQPIYRYTANGAAYPMGGVLYYDPQLGAQPDPAWWKVSNPFDLPYNPHTHPEVQRLAREHPDELIPLAIYTYQTNLVLRPIIAIDFFAPSNPRARESTQQLMVLAKQWLAITTGVLSPERLPYRLITWAANKKGFTPLVDKSSRHGIEELRWALEAGLYFDPALQPQLLKQADQRVLNPLIKPGGVEEWLAHIQYESLRAHEAHALCQQMGRVELQMWEKLRVPKGLSPQEQRVELRRRLLVSQYESRLADFVSQPLGDVGSLAALAEPLARLRELEPVEPLRLQKLLARLYAKLYLQQLSVPSGRSVEELSAALDATRELWAKVHGPGENFARHQTKVEQDAIKRHQKEQARQSKKQVELLRALLKSSHRQFERVAHSGCRDAEAAPDELEAHLVILQEVLDAAATEPDLRAELNRRLPGLRRDLARLEATLQRCPRQGGDIWVAESHQSCLELAHALTQELNAGLVAADAGGGN